MALGNLFARLVENVENGKHFHAVIMPANKNTKNVNREFISELQTYM